ncbi:uncharacterized protein LOC131243142 [Magnolia sinica]|uniref:uncharacterized protein LOC131243142 n=1 Tax=Magnolia sinica TaxID=86752 RepID=UPI002659C596|nr:uncharacterized protein LOC131243142 [Magnolia sinica]
MEALTRSQQGEGVMPASSPKLEDFLGGATMGAHQYGSIDREAMSLSLDNMYYQHNLGHGNLWMDLSNLPELKSPELLENNLYSYIHQYIQSLERDARLEMIEGINEKI